MADKCIYEYIPSYYQLRKSYLYDYKVRIKQALLMNILILFMIIIGSALMYGETRRLDFLISLIVLVFTVIVFTMFRYFVKIKKINKISIFKFVIDFFDDSLIIYIESKESKREMHINYSNIVSIKEFLNHYCIILDEKGKDRIPILRSNESDLYKHMRMMMEIVWKK